MQFFKPNKKATFCLIMLITLNLYTSLIEPTISRHWTTKTPKLTLVLCLAVNQSAPGVFQPGFLIRLIRQQFQPLSPLSGHVFHCFLDLRLKSQTHF